MAFIQYLKIEGENFPMPDTYDIDLTDVESSGSGETEAGTLQRDIIRMGVYSIKVSFSLSPKWLQRMAKLKEKRSLQVSFFNPNALDIKEAEMYLFDFKASLVKDTSYKGLWKVSFSLQEY